MRKILSLALIFFLCVGAGVTSSKSGRTPIGRIYTSSTPYLPVPTVTGFGATPTVTMATGSSDYAGTVGITAGGAGPAASGTVTVTFSSAYAGAGGGNTCIGQLVDQTGTWNARASVKVNQPIASTAVIFGWDNNAVAVVAASSYRLNYICIAR